MASSTTLGKIVDPQSPPNSLLDSLADQLDSKGIDVRRGAAESSLFPSTRPQLATLDGQPLDPDFKGNGGAFDRHFNAGVFRDSILLAISDTTGVYDENP